MVHAVMYVGRVEDPPGSGLFYIIGEDVEVTDTAGLVAVDIDEEPATFVPAEEPGLYLVGGSATEGVYLPTPDPTQPAAWSVDLCSNWERIGKADVFSFTGAQRNNDFGDFMLEIPASAISWSDGTAAVDVDTIRLIDTDGVVRFPGVVSAEGGGAGGYTVFKEGRTSTMRWTGNDLWAYTRWRLALPDPSDVTPGWSVSHDVRGGPAAEVVAGFLMENLGVAAPAARKIDRFVIDTPGGGISDTWQARLQPVSDIIKKVCAAGGITCRFDYAAGDLIARIYPPADWSDSYILSDKGDLSRIEVRHQPASSTWVVAGGTGEGTARLFQLSDFGGTGTARREVFTNQSSLTTAAALYTTAWNYNLEHAAQMFVSVDVSVDAADRIPFGTVVRLGDSVGIEVDGARYTVPLTELRYEINATHQRVLPTLGTATPDALTGLIRDVAELRSGFGEEVA